MVPSLLLPFATYSHKISGYRDCTPSCNPTLFGYGQHLLFLGRISPQPGSQGSWVHVHSRHGRRASPCRPLPPSLYHSSQAHSPRRTFLFLSQTLPQITSGPMVEWAQVSMCSPDAFPPSRWSDFQPLSMQFSPRILLDGRDPPSVDFRSLRGWHPVFNHGGSSSTQLLVHS